jgi:hypothetical protein
MAAVQRHSLISAISRGARSHSLVAVFNCFESRNAHKILLRNLRVEMPFYGECGIRVRQLFNVSLQDTVIDNRTSDCWLTFLNFGVDLPDVSGVTTSSYGDSYTAGVCY